MRNIFDVLDQLNIEYEALEHKAVFTVDEAKTIEGQLEGAGVKNLFLKDKRKNYYLVVMMEDKRADLKALGKMLGTSNFRFCSEETLMDILGLTRGSCTPFGIINDIENQVTVVLDEEFKGQKKLLFHPNRNTATVAITYDDLIRFLEAENHRYIFF